MRASSGSAAQSACAARARATASARASITAASLGGARSSRRSSRSPAGVRVENSIVTLPELPGIGFEGKADLFAQMRALAG